MADAKREKAKKVVETMEDGITLRLTLEEARQLLALMEAVNIDCDTGEMTGRLGQFSEIDIEIHRVLCHQSLN